jgi:hypothetical protein
LAKLAETTIFARVNVTKIIAKKIEKKAFKMPALKRQQYFTKFVNDGESRRFFGR